MEQPAFARCAACGERVGVYEPVVATERSGSRRTSLAREPRLVSATATILTHADCAGAAREPHAA